MTFEEVSYFTEIQNSDRRHFFSINYPRDFSKQEIKFLIKITGDIESIEKNPLTEDQQITKTKDGIRLSFISNQFDNVLEWVLSQGANARPILPKLLVERWSAVVKEMAKLATSNLKKSCYPDNLDGILSKKRIDKLK